MSVVTLPVSAAVAPRKRKVIQRVPVLPAPPAMPSAAVGVATLPMRSVGVGASVTVGGWAIPLTGAVIGGLLLGLPGALVGGIGGYLLARG